MTGKYSFSLDRHDAKLLGVCSGLGKRFGIDPTFIRIGWIAVPLLTPIDVSTAVVAYVIAGIVGFVGRKRRDSQSQRLSDFERMDQVGKIAPDGPRDAHRAGRQRPPDDGDRRPSRLTQLRAGARDRRAEGGQVMLGYEAILMIGALCARRLGHRDRRRAEGLAGLARDQAAGDRARRRRGRDAFGRRPDRDRRPQGAGAQARGDRRRDRYLIIPSQRMPRRNWSEADPRRQADVAAGERGIVLEQA